MPAYYDMRAHIFEFYTILNPSLSSLLLISAQVPSVWTLVHVAPLLSVAGWYLSFFFTLSHNFVGVQQLDNKRETTSILYNQVSRS